MAFICCTTAVSLTNRLVSQLQRFRSFIFTTAFPIERLLLVVVALLLSPFLCMGWSPQFANLSVPFRNAVPGISGILGWIWSQPAAFPAFSVLTAGKISVAVMVFSSPDCTSCLSDGMIQMGSKDFWNTVSICERFFPPSWVRHSFVFFDGSSSIRFLSA